MKHRGAAEFVPASRDLPVLEAAARRCRGCDLWRPATQTVFGRGSPSAAVLLVGEQPGDQEDTQGTAFVGPAGRVLEQALEQAGLGWDRIYVTNAVKHFRFRERGKRRLHQKPTAGQTTACRPWLDAELAAVRPRVVVALGSTAAYALFGPAFSVTRQRGVKMPWPPEDGPFAGNEVPVEAAIATYHPSAALRPPTAQARAAVRDALIADLHIAAAL